MKVPPSVLFAYESIGAYLGIGYMWFNHEGERVLSHTENGYLVVGNFYGSQVFHSDGWHLNAIEVDEP